MAYWHYDRLSALDDLFLEIEEPHVHMHVAAVALFEAAPLQAEDGSLDIERVREALERGLRGSPRFRQRLDRIPIFDHPVWVDDDRFNISYHLRHTSLPRPGGIRLLKRLAGRILSQKLDRGKPLWEMWVVEGVADGHFALIVKAHHCMVDGISGMELLAGMLRPDPDRSLEPTTRNWIPRPAPTSSRLFFDELLRRGAWPVAAANAGRRALCSPQRVLGQLREGALGFGELLKAGLRPTSQTPLNTDVGPHRRFDWARFDLAAAHEVRSRLGGTVNDVVLTTAAGAIGRFLRGRGLRIEDLVFRAQVPMSIRSPAERGQAGNRVVMLLVELPIAERDPRARLARVIATTRELKRSRQRAGVELLEELGDRTLTSLFVSFARLATRQRAFNVVVTNVPGPPKPVYLLGAPMKEIYPLVPLAHNQALGMALFSYDGGLHWGLNADWDAVPDLHDLVEDLALEFESLRKAAAET